MHEQTEKTDIKAAKTDEFADVHTRITAHMREHESNWSPHNQVYSLLFSGIAFVIVCALIWQAWPEFFKPASEPVSQQSSDVDFRADSSSMFKSQKSAVEVKKPPRAVKIALPELTKFKQITPNVAVKHNQKNPVSTSTQPQAKNQLIVTATIGNIRAEPNSNSKILFKLKKGTVVTKLKEQGNWIQVKLKNGTIAWSHSSIF